MKYAIISSGIIGIALARLGAFANQVAISNTCGPKTSRSRRERFQMLEKRICFQVIQTALAAFLISARHRSGKSPN